MDHKKIPQLHWLVVVSLVCFLSSSFVSADEPASPPLSLTAWHELLQTESTWETSTLLLSELRLFPTDDISLIDEVWPRVQLLSFTLSHLMTADELSAFLSGLEIENPDQIDSLLWATFWNASSDVRIPRRLNGLDEDARCALLEALSIHDSPVIRAGAFFVLVQHAEESEGVEPFTERLAALNSLTELCPEAQITQDAVFGLLAIQANVPDHEAVAAEEATALLQTPEELAPRLAYAQLLATSEQLSESESGDPLIAYARLLAHVRDSEWSNALSVMNNAVSVQENSSSWDASFPEATAQTLNALGMALVRANREDDALRVFEALASLYPNSQLSDFAEEHIHHINAGHTD